MEGFLRPAAYLDPGSGSVLLQVLLAALLAAGFLIRAFWGRITSFFKRSSESEEIEEEEV
ncbi:MAG: hypothetical protein GTO18_14065 [Anaerolineales bacterium]|nr:hypothetical protein [Anaerolineales bacterium]